jgi:hypothetical protein
MSARYPIDYHPEIGKPFPTLTTVPRHELATLRGFRETVLKFLTQNPEAKVVR